MNERFTDVKEINKGGLAKVYSATWIDGRSKYHKIMIKVGRKWINKSCFERLNGSQNILVI